MPCRFSWWVLLAGVVVAGSIVRAQLQPALSPATRPGAATATAPVGSSEWPAATTPGPTLTTAPSAVLGLEDHSISLAWSLPFVLLLAAIALMPFIHRHWWEHNYPKVSIALAALVAVYYFMGRREPGPWLREMVEYVSFIVLLGSLFVVSGGIAIRINRRATPAANATLLLIGAVVANVFGTTGAAMLLIRPYLRMNRGHIKPFHVVFFIFIVANVGGSLTPIGDPPLFLGYLKGVPFWWVAEHMRVPWAVATGLLVAIFYVVDARDHRREQRVREDDTGPQVHVLGAHNFLFIALILYAVFRPGFADAAQEIHRWGLSVGRLWQLVFCREVLMLAAAAGSRRLTGSAVYQANEFAFGPIREVAILFVGIFSTMVPALQWLEHNAHDLRIKTPGQFYFASGTLSSFLDNAPTYLTFLQARLAEVESREIAQASSVLDKLKGEDARLSKEDLPADPSVRGAVRAMLKYHEDDVRRGQVSRDELEIAFLIGTPALNIFIVAISAGSVFFGACTYIGNGPNFMVKSIADAAGVKTPSFMEYIVKYTLPVLLPVYVLVWAIFFARG